ncbi:MAG TPA: hypothetical protein VKE98_13805 [Gemmataceae bacterium]|nr:hypothetical protein [Gemmataceae bacterium]
MMMVKAITGFTGGLDGETMQALNIGMSHWITPWKRKDNSPELAIGFCANKVGLDPGPATEQSELTVRSPHIRKGCRLPELGRKLGKCEIAEGIPVR